MNHSIIWHRTAIRFTIVLALIFSMGTTAPGFKGAQALDSAINAQQPDIPVDNTLGGDPKAGYIPAADNPYANLIGEENGPDVTVPGSVDIQPLKDAPAEELPTAEWTPAAPDPSDLSLPANEDLTAPQVEPPAPPQLQDTPAAPEPDQTLGSPEGEVTMGNDLALLAGLTGNLDDFNRPNGTLGGAWADKVAGISIVNSAAQTTFGSSTSSLSVHNSVGTNEAMAWIHSGGSGATQYAGFAFHYADGKDFIFIKIQDTNGDGLFETGACYRGNNGANGEFGLGFFNLSGTFSGAELHVAVHPNRTVTIAITHLTGGGADQSYVCAGAPAAEGGQLGIASYGGGQIDNVTVEAVDPKPLTTFTDQNGPLGSNWWVHSGTFEIVDQKALGKLAYPNLATYNSVGAVQVEADISLSPGGGAQYAGLVLNYDEGVTNLFLKLQDNDGNGTFEHGACYTGNNNSGAAFGLEFFALSSPFSSAHMRVSVNEDRVVHITLTKIDGGSGSQYYQCAGAPPAEGYGVGMASWGGGRVDNFEVIQDFQDNFNRANGSLGSNWVVQAGSFVIANQKAKGTSFDSLATYNGFGARQIEADVSLTPGGGTQYSALVLDYGAGSTNLFIKVQDNGGTGAFDKVGCYIGNNGSGFGAGFFNLNAPFTSAHMIVSVDTARVVTVVFTQIDGGGGTQAYVCGVAPAAEGPLVGIASHMGGLIDNVRVNHVFGLDAFNRPTGDLGPGWETRSGVIALIDQAASGTISTSNLTIFKNIKGNRIEGDVTANPSGETNFSAFILNYGSGVNNLFIKLQNQDGDNKFEAIGCYVGNNGEGFGPGYFLMSSPVSSAHVTIWVNDTRTVTILLTRIDGGLGYQFYSCSDAPAAEGYLVGIASYNGGRIDNVAAAEYAPTMDVFLPTIIR